MSVEALRLWLLLHHFGRHGHEAVRWAQHHTRHAVRGDWYKARQGYQR